MKRFLIRSPRVVLKPCGQGCSKLAQDKLSHRMREHLKRWKAEDLNFTDLIEVMEDGENGVL